MENQVWFLLKVLVLSAIISVLIKYGGPLLNVNGTPLVALILVLLPSIVLAIALWWRFSQRAEN
ncbi:MAG TPA: hypothetical protein V6D28_30975 [Leptolyngbyaceae cyanobacterium]